MQALVDAMSLCARIFYAGHQDLRRRESFGELGDEWDRATHSHIDRLTAPCLPEGRSGGVIDRSGCVDGVRLADVAGCDRDLRPPWRVLFQVTGQCVQMG